jgi:hypothetical protein
MRNILALIGLVVVILAIAGWYLGWYKLSYTTTPDGTLKIQTDVDTKKVGSDSSEIFKNVGSAISSQADKAAQDARTSPPASMPGPISAHNGSDINPMTPMTPVPTIPSIPAPVPPPRNPGTIPLIAPRPND